MAKFEEVKVVGKKLDIGKTLELKRAKSFSNYVKENDPNYFPDGWEEDLIEAIFRYPECENSAFEATPFGFSISFMDGDTVKVPRKIAQYYNANCIICKRGKDQRDPAQPSRWARVKNKGKRRCYFETMEKL